MTENLHNQGYLGWWDELRRRQPNLRLDCCASGGRRNDLETLRRAVPLHRTDYVGEPTSQQCHHYGLSQWVPYHGAGYIVGKSALPPPDCPPIPPPDKIDSYFFRSGMSPSLGISVDVKRDDYDYDFLRRLIAQFRQISPYYYGDFYPLTGYSLRNNVWIAWQYDRPDLGQGMVQAFRRHENNEESQTCKLNGLNPDAEYIVTDLDVNQPRTYTGRDLMETGLQITAKEKPAALIITYEMLK
ncbi:MAG: hypothetical protein BWY71_00705 [Planctomycetes bacterium ADurb.Bin412]|nr:MAG: hypothetical protein BWY71_00705 [Planctomycetes bacterium ADurb.Bin412]